MAKRKNTSDEEDELIDDENSGREEPKPTTRKAKKEKERPKVKAARTKKRVVSESETDGSADEDQPVVKKPRVEQFKKKERPSDESTSITINTNTQGEKYIDLGRKKRLTVNSFKGMPLLDIREFYGPDGDEKPGKKGISLQSDQWEVLKNSIHTIDGLFTSLKKR